MADLSNLFSSMILPVEGGTPDELDPRIASLLKEKDRLAGELSGLKPTEDAVLARMGVNPEQIAADRIAQDKPKGFWKNLGKFAMEGLNGAVNGRSYVPYSERVRNDALKDYQLESGRLGDQLQSITTQKNRINQDQAKLEQAAALMGVKLEDLGIKKDNAKTAASKAATMEQARQDKLPLLGAQVNATNALGGLRGAQASRTESQTKGQDIKNDNDVLNNGLTGNPALMIQRSKNPALDDAISRMMGADAKAKAAAKPAKAAGEVSLRESGKVVDPETGLPLLLNPKTGTYQAGIAANPATPGVPKVTGENAGAASRSVAGYVQVKQLDNLIDKLGRDGKFGLLRGGWEKLLANKGALKDPDIAKYVGLVDSISKFGTGIHGMKAEQAAKKMYDRTMLLMTDPATAKAGVDPIARAFAERAVAIPGAEAYWRRFGIDIKDVRQMLGVDGPKAKMDAAHGVAPKKAQYSGKSALDRLGIK